MAKKRIRTPKRKDERTKSLNRTRKQIPSTVIYADEVHIHPDAPPLIKTSITPGEIVRVNDPGMIPASFYQPVARNEPVKEPDTYIVGMYKDGYLRMFTDVEVFCSYQKALDVAKERTLRHQKPFGVFGIAARTVIERVTVPAPMIGQNVVTVREFKR